MPARSAAPAPATAQPEVSATGIAERVVQSILAQKLAPGERFGEQALADHFGVSHTMVREALMQLQARGFVAVQLKRGWYVVQPSAEEARDAFAARRIIETRHPGRRGPATGADHPCAGPAHSPEARGHRRRRCGHACVLLADFHVCLAQEMGHRLLCDVLRDLTARTTLAASLYQSRHNASASRADHEAIVAAMERGDMQEARQRMLQHIGRVEEALQSEQAEPSQAERLRETLCKRWDQRIHFGTSMPLRLGAFIPLLTKELGSTLSNAGHL